MDIHSHAQANQLFLSYRTSGDPEALTQLFDAASAELLALARHLTVDRSRAEDLLQETFLSAIEMADSWDSERAVMPWLVGILMNKARSARRRANRDLDHSRLKEAHAPDCLQVAQLNELKLEVHKAIQGLSPKDARLLSDVLERDVTPRELAAETGVAMGTLRVRLHRAMTRLRHALPAGFASGGLMLGFGGLPGIRRAIHKAAVARQAQAAPAGASLLAALSPRTSKAVMILGGAIIATATIAAVGDFRFPQPVTPLASWSNTISSDTDVSTELIDSGSLSEPKRTPDADTSEGAIREASSPLATEIMSHRLVLEVSGTIDDLEAPAVLRIRRWRESGATTLHIPVKANGELVVDVASLFTKSPLTDRDKVSIYLRHPDYLDFGIEIPQVKRGSGILFSAPLVLRPITTRLRGMIKLPAEMSVARRWVGFWPGAIPEDAKASPGDILRTETDAFGRFELPIPGCGAGSLFVVVPDLGTLNKQVKFEDKPIHDLGTLRITRGASISGIALFNGSALDGGVEIVATPASASSNQLFHRRAVRSSMGKVVHARVSTTTDKSGYFRMDGLEASVSYHLAIVNPVQNGRTYSYDPLDLTGAVHKAPSVGIQLDSRLAPVQVFVHSDRVPIHNAQLQFQFPKAYGIDPRPNRSQAQYRKLRPSDQSGFLKLAIPQEGGLSVRCTANGFAPLSVKLTHSMVDRRGRISIEMTPAPEGTPGSALIQVAIQLTGPDAATLEGVDVTLELFDRDNGMIAVPTQKVRNSKLWFTGIPQGHYTFALRTGLNQRTVPGKLPYVRTRFTTHYPLDSAKLPSDGVLRLEHEVQLGGRVQLRLEGYDGTPSPAEFELIKYSGYTRRPRTFIRSDQGHSYVKHCVGPGPFWLGGFIEPGPWTIRQVGAAYAETEVPLPLEMGKTTTLVFKLSPR